MRCSLSACLVILIWGFFRISAGLAEYLDIDPTIVRIVWVLMVFFAGFGGLLYVILWLVMPKQQIG